MGDHTDDNKAAKALVKTRAKQIRPKVKAALVAIVETGAKISDAAQTSGLSYEGLRLALQRPHIQAELTRLRRAWLDNETGKSFLTVARLAAGAASEDVMLRAAKFLIEQDQASRAASPGHARQLVQIVFNGPGNGLPDVAVSRSNAAGVFEAPAFDPTADD